MLIYFGYTYCPDVCPTALGVTSVALDGLSPTERAKLVPVFITVDPERDTAAVMKDYVTAFAPDMVGLMGTPEQTNAAKKAFKVYAEKAKGGRRRKLYRRSFVHSVSDGPRRSVHPAFPPRHQCRRIVGRPEKASEVT